MNKQDFQAIKATLKEEGRFRHSKRSGWFWVTLELSVLGTTAYFLAQTEPFSLWYFIGSFLLALSCFRCFALMHECGHGSLFANRRINTFFGVVMSGFCVIPYIAWRNVHRQHHIWTGIVDKDPSAELNIDLLNYSDRGRKIVNRLYKAWIPSPSFALIGLTYWRYPFKQKRLGNKKDAMKGFASLLFVLLVHLVLIIALGLSEYLLLTAVTFVFYLVIFDNINLAHHAGLYTLSSSRQLKPVPLREQDRHTRSTPLPAWLSLIACYNFNFHSEHHYYPNLPFVNLPRVRQELLKRQVESYQAVPFLGFLANLRRNDPIDYYLKTLPSKEELSGKR